MLQDFSSQLIEANHPGDFLRVWIHWKYPKSSFESLAKRCGLSSKGALHDLVSGRRKLSLEKLNAIGKGLGIKRPYRQLLLALRETDTQKMSEKERGLFLKEIRAKVKGINSRKRMNTLPLSRHWDKVFASTGTLEMGATLKEISNRSRMTPERCEKILSELITNGAVRFDHEMNRYFPLSLQNIFEGQSKSAELYLSDSFKEMAQDLSKFYVNADSSLYRVFTFSSRSERFEELRERLKRLIIEFAEDAEVPEGDEVVRLGLAFHQY